MKNDPFFKFTAAIIFAGVIAAFASPNATPAAQTPVAPPSLPAIVNAPANLATATTPNSATTPAPTKQPERRQALQKS